MTQWHLVLMAGFLAAANATTHAADETTKSSMKDSIKQSKKQVAHDVKAVPGGVKATGRAFVNLGKRAGHGITENAKQAKSNFKRGSNEPKESATSEAKSGK